LEQNLGGNSGNQTKRNTCGGPWCPARGKNEDKRVWGSELLHEQGGQMEKKEIGQRLDRREGVAIKMPLKNNTS